MFGMKCKVGLMMSLIFMLSTQISAQSKSAGSINYTVIEKPGKNPRKFFIPPVPRDFTLTFSPSKIKGQFKDDAQSKYYITDLEKGIKKYTRNYFPDVPQSIEEDVLPQVLKTVFTPKRKKKIAGFECNSAIILVNQQWLDIFYTTEIPGRHPNVYNVPGFALEYTIPSDDGTITFRATAAEFFQPSRELFDVNNSNFIRPIPQSKPSIAVESQPKETTNPSTSVVASPSKPEKVVAADPIEKTPNEPTTAPQTRTNDEPILEESSGLTVIDQTAPDETTYEGSGVTIINDDGERKEVEAKKKETEKRKPIRLANLKKRVGRIFKRKTPSESPEVSSDGQPAGDEDEYEVVFDPVLRKNVHVKKSEIKTEGVETDPLAHNYIPPIVTENSIHVSTNLKALPKLDLQTLEGKTISNEVLSGKVTVINFWFIACRPCITEIPHLNKLVEKYAGTDVEFLALGLDKTDRIKQTLIAYPFSYQMIPEAGNTIFDFGVNIYPTHMVFDKSGKLVFSDTGFTAEVESGLLNAIDKALNGQ